MEGFGDGQDGEGSESGDGRESGDGGDRDDRGDGKEIDEGREFAGERCDGGGRAMDEYPRDADDGGAGIPR